MLKMRDWCVYAPPNCTIGFDGEHNARMLEIEVDEPSMDYAWKLEIEHQQSGEKNIVDLNRDGNILSVLLTRDMIRHCGVHYMQVRGVRGEEVKKSNRFYVMVGESISASDSLPPLPPSEFAQMEARITALKTETEQAAKNVQADAERAASAADEAETFSLNAPKIVGGTWHIYDPNALAYVDTGIAATGPHGDKGDKGDTGAQGDKGDKGDPFTYADFTDAQLAALKGEQGEKGEKGDKGDTGATGEKGDKGDKGDPFTYADFTPEQLATLKGEKGDKGDKGEKGDTGDTGAQGTKGDKGDPFTYADFTDAQLAALKGEKGDTGATGATGEKGEKGDPGQDGTSFTIRARYDTLDDLLAAHPTGEAGEAYAVGTADDNTIYNWSVEQSEWQNLGRLQGPQGEKGDKGDKGDTGATGEKGDKGDKGDPFTYADFTPEQLATLKGEKGDKGDKGEKGDPGAAGKSAYAAAQEQGFSGTETAFGAALSGLPTHLSDTDLHISASERAAWNAKAAKPTVRTLTLSTAGWDSTTKTQTVMCAGVSADETAQLITVTPALASQSAYLEAGIRCTAQAANALTFTATTVPTAELTVYAAIQTM